MSLFGKKNIAIFLFVGVHIMVASLFFVGHVSAMSITWDGGAATSNWCDAANWSNNTLPTDADDVTINTAVTVSTNSCADGDVDFNSLIIGGTAAATLDVFAGDFGTVGDITIANLGTLEQNTTSQISISGDLTIASGGTLTHADNSTVHLYSVNISAINIDVQSGGSVNVNQKGFDGGTATSGYGPGSGIRPADGAGTGGGHAGYGGNKGSVGSVVTPNPGYCVFDAPTTLGSGGGSIGSYSGIVGGAGGGFVSLAAHENVTLDGGVQSNGGVGGSIAGYGAGGGAGGSVHIQADTITGNGSISVAGGASGAISTDGGGGGGSAGCVAIDYVSANSLGTSNVTLAGGDGAQRGAGGTFVINSDSFYTANTTANGAYTNFTSDLEYSQTELGAYADVIIPVGVEVGLGDITAATTADLEIVGTMSSAITGVNGYELILQSGSLLSNVGVTFTMSGASAVFRIYNGQLTQFDNITMSAGSVVLYNYTTAAPLSMLGDLVINGGTLSHEANSTLQTHIINIEAENITIGAGVIVNADSRGYANNTGSGASGNGPGAAIGASTWGSGAGHGGDGGIGSGATGKNGVAYCTADVDTIGSSGANTTQGGAEAGDGGGLIWLVANDTITVAGTITADGGVGGTSGGGYYSGSGAGGGIKLAANTIVKSGTPSITATGGNAGGSAGSGGGGCILVQYGQTSGIASGDVSVIAGTETGADTAGTAGTFSLEHTNTAPNIAIGTPTQETIYNGTTLYRDVIVTTTVSDSDLNNTTLTMQYSLDGSTWASTTISSVTLSEGGVVTDSGFISSIDTSGDGSVDLEIIWDAAADIADDTYDTTVYLRFTPNDGSVDGDTVTSTAFTIDFADPSTPGDIVFDDVSSSSLRVGLPNPTSSDPNLVGYALYMNTSTSVLSGGTPEWGGGQDANLLDGNWNGATSTLIDAPVGRLIDGIVPNTLYYLQLVAFDVHGNIATTAETSTTTHAAVPVSFATTTVATSSVSLSWGANGNPIGTVYTVSTTGYVATTTDTFITVSSLWSDTEYVFEVYATNADAVDTASQTLLTRTQYNNYEPEVTIGFAAQMSSTRAEVVLQASDFNALFVPDISLVHTLSFATSSEGPWQPMTIAGVRATMGGSAIFTADEVTQTLPNESAYAVGISWDIETDLPDVFATMYVQVITTDGYGGQDVATTSVAIDTTVPKAPYGFTLLESTTSSLQIGWVDDSNNETGFIVEYVQSEDINGVFGFGVDLDPNTTSTIFTGLSLNTPYIFRVASYNDNGQSDFVTSTVFYTDDTVPLAIFSDQPAYSGGSLIFDVALADVPLSDISALVEYSIDDGSTWASSTLDLVNVSGSDTDVTTSTGLVSNIEPVNYFDGTSVAAYLQIQWLISSDLPIGTYDELRIRITPFKLGVTGDSIVSDQFSVDTEPPTNAGSIVLEDIGTDTLLILRPDPVSSDESGNVRYTYWFATSSPVTGENYMATWDSRSDVNLRSADWNGATSTLADPVGIGGPSIQPNTSYYISQIVQDGSGNTADTVETSFVTLALVPEELIVEDVSSTTISLSWDDSGATQYKLYNVTDDNELFASVSITEATATGLVCDTEYVLRLYGHNQVDIPSVDYTEVSTTTSACDNEEEGEEESSRSSGTSILILQKPNFGSTIGTSISALTQAIAVHKNRSTTTVRRVRVHIPAYIDVSEAAISMSSSFDGTQYKILPKNRTLIVTLPKGYGKKELYIKLRTATGGTAVVKKEIIYEKRKTPASVSTSVIGQTTSTVSTPIQQTTFVSFLSRGSQGVEVIALQRLLQRLGYFPSTIAPNGVYGPSTEESVRAFQRANGIDPLGYVGPGTRSALNAL